MNSQTLHPVLIIGSGASGLALALQLAEDHEVTVLAKESIGEGATFYAQGGVSAVLDAHDSVASHIRDTLQVGAGLCVPETVHFVIESGPAAIAWLSRLGVPFARQRGSTKKPPPYHLHREGGHSHRRIAHVADSTGKAIENTLERLARDHPRITLLEKQVAVDLLIGRGSGTRRRILGVYVLDTRRGRIRTHRARCVVLATGGAGKVYLYTSNPDIATGDGIAMAWRAGCRIANMEFVQFHPTCLYHPRQKNFLISEALRGEGGKLLLPDGSRFMPGIDERAELAPRDVVARAIDHEMKRKGLDCVYLDVSHLSARRLRKEFPNIHSHCLDCGLDISRDPIPVVPAAHYICGGIWTDRNGRAGPQGLYAIGETACTGLHGANRMASNSLLECLVYAHSCYQDIRRHLPSWSAPGRLPEWDESRVTDSDEEIVLKHNWQELRRCMWDYVGIVRSDKRLRRAANRLRLLRREIQEYYGHFKVDRNLIELRNLALVAELIVHSARKRRESRGLHYNLDYPHPAAATRPTTLRNRRPSLPVEDV